MLKRSLFRRVPVALAGAILGSLLWPILADAILVAPITIGAGAYVAAGSTLTENVPDGALALGIAAVFTAPELRGQGYAGDLIERIIGIAEADGFDFAMLFSEIGADYYARHRFNIVPHETLRLELRRKPGAPGVVVRTGDRQDIPHIVNMHRDLASGYRLSFDRTPEWIEFAADPAPRMFRMRLDGSGLECLYQHGNDEFVVHETFLGLTGDLVYTVWPHSLWRMGWRTLRREKICDFNAWHITPDRAGARVLCDTNHPDRGLWLIDAASGARRQVCLTLSSDGAAGHEALQPSPGS